LNFLLKGCALFLIPPYTTFGYISTSAANGLKSNGPKTERGRLSILAANVTNGSRCWSPVLPGESQQDWEVRLEGVRQSLNPANYLQEQLAFNVALTFQQWDRLHRYERANILEHIEQEVSHRFFDKDKAEAILNLGAEKLRSDIAKFEHLLGVLDALPKAGDVETLDPEDGRSLVRVCHFGCYKRQGVRRRTAL
jgi:hypothetical protein